MKNIIVREYLESLTERDELDYLFPILLEVMDFTIVSTPKITQGLAQYGKDIVAVGPDKDGIRKRFYFEIKGGADKNITTSTFAKNDGIRMSIIEAKDKVFNNFSIPGFNSLPVKVVVVHNGILHAGVKDTFDDFIAREFPPIIRRRKNRLSSLFSRSPEQNIQQEFERLDIFSLTELFTKHLFNEYLLTDDAALNNFKKVLVLINTPRNTYNDYFQLIDSIFDKACSYNGLPDRKKVLFYETIKLVSYIIYTYAKEYGNLEPAIKCIPYAILKHWAWALKNGVEKVAAVREQFNRHVNILRQAIADYYGKTLSVASLKDGLFSEKGGQYEMVGYPVRSMAYIAYLVFHFELQTAFHKGDKSILQTEQVNALVRILENNSGTNRPLFDIHSIPICLILNFFISNNRVEDAKNYLKAVFHSIQLGFNVYQRIPDGYNNMQNMIRFMAVHKKSVYYVDDTSQLIGILFEYLAILNMKQEYDMLKPYFSEMKIQLGVFVPYNDEDLKKVDPDNTKSHELLLLTKELNFEGYQSEIKLNDDFETFRETVLKKNEFTYSYKTTDTGLGFLLTLAHIYNRNPFFPNYWRTLKIS